MKSRVVYLLGLGAMCAAGQTGPRASDPPATTPVAAASAAPTLPPTGEDLRKRVVVDAFGYSTVLPSVQAVFNPYAANPKNKQAAPPPPNVGAGIQAMLMQRLSEEGQVIIVDRNKSDEIKKLQPEEK